MKILEASLLAFDENDDKMILQLEKIKKNGIETIHYDVMDGIFVKNISFFGNHLTLIKKMGFKIFVHLMVQDVNKYINKFLKYDIDYLTFHCEPILLEECIKQIKKIKSHNILAGIAIKPNTKISDIINLINLSDIITVMSVEPGMGGQVFIKQTLTKLKEIKKYNQKVLIQVDGGINLETGLLIKSYTDFFVMGTFLINNIDNIKLILRKLFG